MAFGYLTTPVSGFKIRVFNETDNKTEKIINYHEKTLSFNTSVVFADPFLFVNNGMLYLFYEEMKFRGNGFLVMTKTKDLKHWSTPRIVLKEELHLSFPFVFEDNGTVYMIPETGHDKSIRLYSANGNLLRFTYVKTLIEGKEYVDTSVISHNGLYYLFTTEKNKQFKYTQRLFWAESLGGAYKEHPCSPIYNGGKYGRNAGSILQVEGDLFRPVQDCANVYGENVSLLKIEELDQNNYKEVVYKDKLLDKSLCFYKDGGHQYNVVNFHGQRLVATDAKFNNANPNIGIMIQRLFRAV